MFQLTKEDCLRCQIGTLNGRRGEHLKYMPYAFTENGIAMLSGVLRSPAAIEVNISIMRAFVAMRRVFANVEPLLSRVESVERRQIASPAVCGGKGEAWLNSPPLRSLRLCVRQSTPHGGRDGARPSPNLGIFGRCCCYLLQSDGFGIIRAMKTTSHSVAWNAHRMRVGRLLALGLKEGVHADVG